MSCYVNLNTSGFPYRAAFSTPAFSIVPCRSGVAAAWVVCLSRRWTPCDTNTYIMQSVYGCKELALPVTICPVCIMYARHAQHAATFFRATYVSGECSIRSPLKCQ